MKTKLAVILMAMAAAVREQVMAQVPTPTGQKIGYVPSFNSASVIETPLICVPFVDPTSLTRYPLGDFVSKGVLR